jgi:hypothetical protein
VFTAVAKFGMFFKKNLMALAMGLPGSSFLHEEKITGKSRSSRSGLFEIIRNEKRKGNR